jgi:glucose-6-phosphate 1-dehydrogenase
MKTRRDIAAFPKWSLERLHKRVTDSIKRPGGIDDKRALRNLLSRLTYVIGDYKDAGTFVALKKALGNARHPAHDLAIPPSLFGTAIKGLGAANSGSTFEEQDIRRALLPLCKRRQTRPLAVLTMLALVHPP